MQHISQTPSLRNLPFKAPWSLRAWPALLWQADTPVPVRFQHLGTHVEWIDSVDTAPSGQTAWAMVAREGRAGMAWDWVQIASGVLAIADPMSLVTNMRLISDEGALLTAQQSSLYLNKVVRALPWQAEVQRALNTHTN